MDGVIGRSSIASILAWVVVDHLGQHYFVWGQCCRDRPGGAFSAPGTAEKGSHVGRWRSGGVADSAYGCCRQTPDAAVPQNHRRVAAVLDRDRPASARGWWRGR